MNTFRLRWTTIGLVSVSIVATAVTFASGEVIRIISPPSATTGEGNSFRRPNLIPIRIQHLFPASDFANLPETNRLIVAYNFRADRTQSEQVDWHDGDEQIWMSTTDKEVLTDVFEDNHGPDRTMVHDGAIIYPLLTTGPARGPRDIADGARLDAPFLYDPSKGNLLVDRLVFANNPSVQANIDTQETSFARILINDVDPFSETGSLLTEIAVNQFEFAPSVLQAGDADQDWDFDQSDVIQVQVAAKYLTGQSATWGEGDWDGAPGGEPGNPPPGNGLFDQLDVVAALAAGTYLAGPYATVQPNGQSGDGQTSVVYHAGTGEVSVDAPAGTELTSININSASGIFTGQAAMNLGGSFDNDADANIFKATFGSSFGSLSFGHVARAGLSEEVVLNDLTVIGSLAGGGDLGNVDLIYVPEPATVVMLSVGLAIGLLRFRIR